MRFTMKTRVVLTLVACCTVTGSALAAMPDPADASVGVPAPQYVSPLADYSAMPDSSAPDKNWRAANADAAQQDSMAGMDMSGMDMSHDAPTQPEIKPKPAAPAMPAGMDMSGHGSHPHAHGGSQP
jgi:hypothetical protein